MHVRKKYEFENNLPYTLLALFCCMLKWNHKMLHDQMYSFVPAQLQILDHQPKGQKQVIFIILISITWQNNN